MSEINMMPGVSIAASGLYAQRRRLDVIAENIANASTTRTAEGTPYRRRVVELRAGGDVELRRPGPRSPVQHEQVVRTRAGHLPGRGAPELGRSEKVGVEVAGVRTDGSDFPQIYDPSHPDADAQGFVAMPNVDLLGEMVDLMLASRVYEANLTVLESSRETAKQALDLLR